MVDPSGLVGIYAPQTTFHILISPLACLISEFFQALSIVYLGAMVLGSRLISGGGCREILGPFVGSVKLCAAWASVGFLFREAAIFNWEPERGSLGFL